MYKILLIFSGHDLVKPPVERGNRRSERHNALTLYGVPHSVHETSYVFTH